MYRLMRRVASLIHTSEIQMSFNLSLIILELIFVNVKTLIMRSLFLEQAHGARASYMVLAGDLVPAGTTLVTPVIDLLVTTVFVCDHQVQKFSYGLNKAYSVGVAPSHQHQYQILKVSCNPVKSVVQLDV